MQHIFHKIGSQIVIGIYKRNVIARNQLQAGIARSAKALVLLMHHPDATILLRILLGNAARSIGRTIVHTNNLEVTIRLS